MSPGPNPVTVTLTAQDRAELEAITRKATAAQREAFRAQIVLFAADGYNNTEIAEELDCTRKTARKWRGRFAAAGRAGLKDEPRPGRPRLYDTLVRALVLAIACELPAQRGLPLSRLSTGDIHDQAAQELDPCPSRSTIAAWLKQAAIKPWTVRSWVTPRDPDFQQKAAPVLDLYNGFWEGEELTPRDVIISADEKTGVQARSRRRTPPGPGKDGHLEHQYKRHGTTVYQAALFVGTGEVHGHCVQRNTRKNFEMLVENVMDQPICQRADRVFWIVDGGGAHHPATFPQWVTQRYPTVECLHLPTGASWLNQIELYFSVLSRKALTGESFSSVDAVNCRIAGFEGLWNSDPEPFNWTYTRHDLKRRCETLPAVASSFLDASLEHGINS